MIKKIDQIADIFQPLIVITALFLAMLAEDGTSLLLKWGVLSLLWGIALWRLRNPNYYYAIIKDKVFIYLLIFIAWAIFSSLTLSVAKSISIIMLMPFIAGSLSYFIAFSSNDKQELYFENLFLCLGLGLVIFTSYQIFVLNLYRPAALVSNPNAHAAYLGMVVLPFLVKYSLKPNLSLRTTITVSVLCFIFAFTMGLTQSRGALIVIIGTLIFLAAVFLKQRFVSKQSLFFIAALTLGFFFISLFFPDSFFDRLLFAANAESVAKAMPGRFVIWPAAWQMFLDKPVLGWGIGLFSFLYTQYKIPLSFEAGYFAHSDYLQFLIELGPLGLFAFLLFIFFLLSRIYSLGVSKLLYKNKQRVEAFTYLAVALSMLAHTLVTFHMYHLTMQIVWGYYLGRSAKYFYIQQSEPINKSQQKKSAHFNLYRKGFSSAIVLISICLGLSFYYLEKGDLAKNNALKLDYYWKSQLLFPAFSRYDSLNASELTEQLFQLKSGISDEQDKLRNEIALLALNNANKAIDKVPFYINNYVTKINIYRNMGWDQEIVFDSYDQVIKYRPHLFNMRHQFSTELIKAKKYDKAISILWGAWDRWNIASYSIGIEFLNYQLSINEKYGNLDGIRIIEREIQRLKQVAITAKKKGGTYAFKKKKTLI